MEIRDWEGLRERFANLGATRILITELRLILNRLSPDQLVCHRGIRGLRERTHGPARVTTG